MDDFLRGTYDPNAGFATQGDDGKMWCEFRNVSTIDGIASREKGYPVYHDIAHCRLIQPGESRLSVYDQPAREQDKQRFPRQWDNFLKGKAQDAVGAPISLLFADSPAMVDNMKRIGVHTIEQLAGASDSAIQEMGLGGRQFQERAKQYLATADKGKDYHTLAASVDQMTLRLQELESKNTALAAALSEAQTKRGPGRPRKDETEAA